MAHMLLCCFLMMRGLLTMAKKLLIDLNLSGLNHMFILEDKNIQPVRFGILDDIKTSVYSLLDAENISDILLTG